MINTHRSWWRARWRETPAAALPERTSDEDIADRQALGALVRQALAGLPGRQRAVLVLRYCEDLSEDAGRHCTKSSTIGQRVWKY
jgi:DNA-directed RNA polymerase specialized sigma24 family protein